MSIHSSILSIKETYKLSAKDSNHNVHVPLMLLLDMILFILRQKCTNVVLSSAVIDSSALTQQGYYCTDSEMHVLKLHLCNFQRVQTWQGEKGDEWAEQS